MRPLLAHCHVSRARLERAAGRPALARPLYEMGIEAFRALDMPFWRERTEAEARATA
jgi:hypothetical protein